MTSRRRRVRSIRYRYAPPRRSPEWRTAPVYEQQIDAHPKPQRVSAVRKAEADWLQLTKGAEQ